MMTVAFPTEFEACGFLRRLERLTPRDDVPGVTYYTGRVGKREVRVVITGIGPVASRRSLQTFLEQVKTEVVMLAGFAGALTDSVYRGQILVAQGYSSPELVNYIRLVPGFDIARVHPVTEPVVSAAEKRSLGLTTGCQMVDMETAYLSELVTQMNIEFLCVRAISDLVNEDLPQDVLDNGYDLEASKTTPARMALYLITRPRRIKALKEFVKPLAEVRDRLGDFLYTVIEEF